MGEEAAKGEKVSCLYITNCFDAEAIRDWGMCIVHSMSVIDSDTCEWTIEMRCDQCECAQASRKLESQRRRVQGTVVGDREGALIWLPRGYSRSVDSVQLRVLDSSSTSRVCYDRRHCPSQPFFTSAETIPVAKCKSKSSEHSSLGPVLPSLRL